MKSGSLVGRSYSKQKAQKVEPIVLNRLAAEPGQRVGDHTFHLVQRGRRTRSRRPLSLRPRAA